MLRGSSAAVVVTVQSDKGYGLHQSASLSRKHGANERSVVVK